MTSKVQLLPGWLQGSPCYRAPAGFGLAQLRMALQGARQQALAAVAPSVLTASAPAFTPRPILLRNPASAGGGPPVLQRRPPMGPGPAPPPPVGPPPALGSASQGLRGGAQPPPPPPPVVPLPGMQGSGRAVPPAGLVTAPIPPAQGFQENMASPHVGRLTPPGRPGPGPVSQGFQGCAPLPSMRSSLSATAALPAVDVWLAACETLAGAIESVLQPAQQQVMAVRLASMPEPPTVSADPTRVFCSLCCASDICQCQAAPKSSVSSLCPKALAAAAQHGALFLAAFTGSRWQHIKHRACAGCC